jgi:predicted nuclease with TOPRIM domain
MQYLEKLAKLTTKTEERGRKTYELVLKFTCIAVQESASVFMKKNASSVHKKCKLPQIAQREHTKLVNAFCEMTKKVTESREDLNPISEQTFKRHLNKLRWGYYFMEQHLKDLDEYDADVDLLAGGNGLDVLWDFFEERCQGGERNISAYEEVVDQRKDSLKISRGISQPKHTKLRPAAAGRLHRASVRSTSASGVRPNPSRYSGGSESDDDLESVEEKEQVNPEILEMSSTRATTASGSQADPSGCPGGSESDKEREELEERITELQLKNARLESELATKDHAINAKDHANKVLRNELDAAEQKVLSIAAQNADLSSSLKNLQEELDAAQNADLSSSLKNLQEELNVERNHRFAAQSKARKIFDEFKAYVAANENPGEGGMEGDEESSDEYQSEKEE